MRSHFLNPDTDDINILLDLIKELDSNLAPYKDANLSRIKGTITDKYETFLECANLPDVEQTSEKVLADIAPLFKGAVRWHYPGTLININPPPLLPAVAASAYASLFNPNLAMDVPSGGLALAELEVIKHIATLAGWDWKNAHGVFTFGGKGTNLYAVKVGLHHYSANFMNEGINDEMIVFSTQQGHPCHIEVCDWLGIGKNNCIRLPVDSLGMIDLVDAEQIMRACLRDGKKIACIIVNGGSTLHNTVDPITEIADMRDRLIDEFNLGYTPHLHVDAVIGWAWLFFKDYDFENNPLEVDEIALKKIHETTSKMEGISIADSFGVDFHKTGFCPYVSSLFMVRERSRLENLGASQQPSLSEMEFGNYAPFTYSLESSRAATSALVALVSLKSLGILGFQKLIAQLVSSGETTRQRIKETKGFQTVNSKSMGFVTLFIMFPPHIRLTYDEVCNDSDAKKIFEVAEYNYKFYLYMLELQVTENYPVAIDYISGYDVTISGVKMGVLKIYPMSPFYDKEYVETLLQLLINTKKEFDLIFKDYTPKHVPYRPKPFVTR